MGTWKIGPHNRKISHNKLFGRQQHILFKNLFLFFFFRLTSIVAMNLEVNDL